MKTIESFVYVKSQQGSNSVDTIVNSIASLEGVMKANINDYVAGIMNIEHDPEQITGGRIVDHLKQSGYSSYQFGF